MTAAQRYAFLGPEGTFTEAALRQVITDDDQAVAAGSVMSALSMVRRGEVDAAVVPIENSVEGGVSATLDSIAAGSLQIYREVLVPITFVLVSPDARELSAIQEVTTHSHAWAQVRGWAEETIPHAEFVPAGSTAAGARALHPGQAGVCAPHLAQELGLHVLASAIEDTPGAVTRFVVVSGPGSPGKPTGSDKTTLVVPLPQDRPGALMQILEQFSARGINLSRIESRPTGAGLGQYFFSIDLEGHLADQRVGASLAALYRMFPQITFLGSYPRADRRHYQIDEHFSGEAYQRGQAWVRQLLAPDAQ
ncbi:prephenate dehydratase [Auritidibacter sp. NML120636]|uniref:prephenate dehydratase n=1 Tax=Auritidibacter sp. NML120636 TaxID=2170743 RepID=UPI000D73BDF7|nr:prephenate dehydratase [Auritidibacter sp. NML120636]PXA79048.1 prephenate dehydratase [Auritidibacter sp. NML120636]